MADIEMLLEAERRGILPADKSGLLQEARNRGLIPSIDQPAAVSGGPRATGTLADQIPGSSVKAPAATQPVGKDFTFGQKVMGALEVAPALVTGALTAPLVEAAKIGGTLTSGKFGTQAGIRAGEEAGRRMQERFYQPRTEAGQQYVGDIGNALASTGLQGVPMNVLGDLQRGMMPATRAVTDFGGAKVAQRTERLAQEASAKDWARAPKIDASKSAQELGLAINPAESNPSMGTNLAVGAAGKSNVSIKNAKANLLRANEIAREDLGLPENTPLDSKAWNTALAKHDAPYQAVEKIPLMEPSSEVMDQLSKLKVDALSTSSPEKAAKINGVIDRVSSQVANGLSGKNVVGQSRDFRKEANRTLNNPNSTGIEVDIAEAQLGIAEALENLIENNISNPRALDEFRAARTGKAKVYDWERATGVTTKQVDPAQLVKLAEKNKPLSGKLAQVAEVAGNFPKDFDTSRNYMKEAFQYLRRGGVGGTIGFAMGGPVGAAIGAGVTSLGGEAAARMLARPGVQNRLAMPADRRIPLPVEPQTPMAPIPQNRAVVPFDYSQQTFTPPNFTMVPEQYGPRVVPGTPEAPRPNTLGYNPNVPSTAEVQMNRLRKEDVLDYGFRQRVEAEQAAAEAATRQPTRGGTAFELDPVTGKLVPVDTTIQRATPDIQIIEDTGKTLASAVAKMSGQVIEQPSTSYKTMTVSPKSGAQPYTRIIKREGETTFERGVPQSFNMTAEEKIAWDRTKVDLADVVPGMKSLNDKAIAAKMQDRAWVQDAIAKAQEKARAFQDIAARANTERLRQDALMKREQMMDLLENLESQFSKARPVKSGGQGPKTRAFQRNMLTPEQEIQNALVK